MHSYRLESFNAPLVEHTSDVPSPQGGEVVLAVGSCGVCHSDVHFVDGYFDLGGGQRVDLTRSVAPPRVLGHEIAGTVVAIGPDVVDAKVGDRRVAYPWIGCGRCAICESGDEHLCRSPRALGVNRDGGFADHVLVPDAKYLFDYRPLDEEQACTHACAGLTAYSALKKVAPLAHDATLVVVGAGGVGLSGVRMAAALGLPAPIVAEVDRAKWDLARGAGAKDTIDPRADDAVRMLMKSVGGADAVVDFVGSADSFAFGVAVLKKGGTLVSVGLIGGAAAISPAMIAMKAARILGSYVGSLAEMGELMTFARSAAFPALPVTSMPLSSASETIAELKAGRVRGRAVLKP